MIKSRYTPLILQLEDRGADEAAQAINDLVYQLDLLRERLHRMINDDPEMNRIGAGAQCRHIVQFLELEIK